MQRLIAGLSVREVSVSPTSRFGISFRVLDHELYVHGRPSKDQFKTSAGKTGGQHLVVQIRSVFIPVQRRNYRAVWK